MLTNIIKFFETLIHLDKYLLTAVEKFGSSMYLIIFLVIFAETGLVVAPFLPGDSLLFAIGAIAANIDSLNIWLLFGTVSLAAILGDSLNYWVGEYFGLKVLRSGRFSFLRKEYLLKTEKFYEKHGNKAILLGRFFPIIRTFVPFVAGVGKMNYKKFVFYNIVGGFTWAFAFLFCGYFFGNIKIVKENFTFVVFGIIFISLLPGLYQMISGRFIQANPTVDDVAKN